MASVRHLDFAKIAFLSRDRYLHAILHLHSEIRINWPMWRRDIAKKQFSIWRPSAILVLKSNSIFVKFDARNGNLYNLYMCTKFDRNRILLGRYMEIKLFSKWRPSAISNLRKSQFRSRELYWHAIHHLSSKFRVDRPIWRRDIAKTIFNMASVRHLGFVMTSS